MFGAVWGIGEALEWADTCVLVLPCGRICPNAYNAESPLVG